MKWVDLVGIELEGGWRELWPFGRDEDPKLVADDSLPTAFSNSITGDLCAHTGEKTSPPLPWSEVPGWIKKYYPQEMNERCGLHVHVSMKSAQAYSLLGSLAFYQHFLEGMEKWGTEALKLGSGDQKLFFNRLLGVNKYCVPRMDPYEQMKARNKAEARRPHGPHGHQLRRTHLNFPYSMLKTVECRLFPMFSTADISVDAVKTFVQMCEDWTEENFSSFEAQRSYRIIVKGPMRRRGD